MTCLRCKTTTEYKCNDCGRFFCPTCDHSGDAGCPHCHSNNTARTG